MKIIINNNPLIKKNLISMIQVEIPVLRKIIKKLIHVLTQETPLLLLWDKMKISNKISNFLNKIVKKNIQNIKILLIFKTKFQSKGFKSFLPILKIKITYKTTILLSWNNK